MKAHYRTANGRLTFEVQAEDAKTLFREVARVQEVFDAETACGLCRKTNLRFLARQVDDYDFYELACVDCHARFAFGQAKKGGALFPKRKDEDGNWLPNGGWSRYEKPGTETKTATAQTAASTPPAKTEKKNGVPVFDSWQAAENSEHWGTGWLDVAGKLYKLSPDGANYHEVQRTAKEGAKA